MLLSKQLIKKNTHRVTSIIIDTRSCISNSLRIFLTISVYLSFYKSNLIRVWSASTNMKCTCQTSKQLYL